MQQRTVSKGGQPVNLESAARGRQSVEATEVASSPAALEFNIAGVLTAALAIAAAALFYHGSGSMVIIGTGFACVVAAALLQIAARRRLRDELIDDARRHGSACPEAEAKANMERWLEHR